MEEEADDTMASTPAVGIIDLPEEILEYILSLTSPYRDFQAAKLVCKQWYQIMKGVIQQEHNNFYQAVADGCIEWSCQPPEYGATITERYSHSACYHNKSLYVFGGCTSTNTTFNDLWRFDLGTRQWVRPLALGTYPSPKACASLVAYKDSLILFGGWSHPTPYPLHQAARFFNQLHIYSTTTNRWSHVLTSCAQPTQSGPAGLAGHAASIVEDKMIVFGGSKGHGVSCNDIWVLDLEEMTWSRMDTADPKPHPRYGHSQIVIDDSHIMVLGGCGGPNMQFTDLWLLTVDTSPWHWHKLNVLNPENCPPQLWCHPACKVEDKVVVMSKTSVRCPKTPPAAAKSTQGQVRLSKVWVPPKLSDLQTNTRPPSQGQPPTASSPSSNHGDKEEERRGNFKRPLPVSHESSSDEERPSGSDSTSAGVSGHSVSSQGTVRPHASSSTGGASRDLGAVGGPIKRVPTVTSPVREGLPSVRPNAMKNRQKQLETLKRYEDKIKKQAVQSGHCVAKQPSNPVAAPASGPEVDVPKVQNPMFLHVLDISRAISEGQVSWQPVNWDCEGLPPEETIFYSLVHGRGELILFGGVQADLNSMQRGLKVISQIVSNNIHFIKARRILR